MLILSLKILAIGNALVDIVARIEPEALAELGVAKGGMTLVDAETSKALYATTRNPKEVSGGSAANTIAIAAALGAATSYAGKVSADTLGDIFLHDLASQGVDIIVPAAAAEAGLHTGNCLSLITPDAQRTMCTHLGAAQSLLPDDIDPGHLAAADIVFLEGYLLDAPAGRDIFETVLAESSAILALTLSDAACVGRHAAFLQDKIGAFDLLFGNAEEMRALFPDARTAEAATALAAKSIARVICTDGPEGVHLAEAGSLTHLPALPVKVVDTTGAGDSFAGTVLWALADGRPLEEAARLALRIAAEVISEIGARPSRDIAQLLRDEGLLSEPA